MLHCKYENFKIKMDLTLSGMSFNIHSYIFSFLEPRELYLVGQTCKILRQNSELDHVWKSGQGATGKQKKQYWLTGCAVDRNVKKGKFCSYLLTGHKENITQLDIDGDKILSSSKDGNIIEWDLENNRSKVYKGHSNWVVAAYYTDYGILSASSDKTLRLWKSPTESKIYRGHTKAIVNLVMLGETTAVTGSYDESVRLWDIRRRKPVTTFDDR